MNLISMEKILLLLTKYGGVFWKGVQYTLVLSAITVLCGAVVGSMLCILKMSGVQLGGWLLRRYPTLQQRPILKAICSFQPLSFFVSTYVELVRGTPLLLQLYVFYYILPALMGQDFSQFTSIVIALVINSSAYVCELVRSGIQSVDPGQAEAARSLGLSKSQTMTHIVYPQAIKNILPALGNEFVMVIKETSLASTFFIGDLMTQYRTLSGALYMIFEPLLIVGVIYFVLTFTLSMLIALAERRMAASD